MLTLCVTCVLTSSWTDPTTTSTVVSVFNRGILVGYKKRRMGVGGLRTKELLIAPSALIKGGLTLGRCNPEKPIAAAKFGFGTDS